MTAEERLAKAIASQLKLAAKINNLQRICASLRKENQRMATELATLEKYRSEFRSKADEMEERVKKTMETHPSILR